MTTTKRLERHLQKYMSQARSVDFPYPVNRLNYFLIRPHFVTRNGISVSIQQSAFHYCADETEVEMWCCPHAIMLAPYDDGTDPYSYVPLYIVAEYIDYLESPWWGKVMFWLLYKLQ